MKRQGRVQQPKTSGREVLDIPIECILPDPHQPRKKFRGIEELGQSVDDQELQQPLVVNRAFVKDGVQFYYIKAGERRWRACTTKGKDVITCVVDPKPYDGTRSFARRLEQTAENFSRSPHTHGEIIDIVEEAVQEEFLTRGREKGDTRGAVGAGLARIARALGKSYGWAQAYHNLSGLLPELRDMLDDDEEGEHMNFQCGLALARAPRETQKQLLADAGPHFKRGGHAAGYAFIVRRAREIREARGEKVRGRASDEKAQFLGALGRFAKFGEQLRSGHRANEFRAHAQEIIARMAVVDVDLALADLSSGLTVITIIRELLEAKRAENYRSLAATQRS